MVTNRLALLPSAFSIICTLAPIATNCAYTQAIKSEFGWALAVSKASSFSR
jgi:hypothetical protein